MGYYLDQLYYEDLVVADTLEPGTTEKKTIDIFNNDSLYLVLENVEIAPGDKSLTNPDSISILTIVIDWGDGKKDQLNPENFARKKSGAQQFVISWMNIWHTYHFHDGTTDSQITITIYDNANNKYIVIIPLRIKLKSLAETRAKFELISANITNDNQVSYVIHDATTKQMIVLKSKQEDWTENKSFLDKKTALYNSVNAER